MMNEAEAEIIRASRGDLEVEVSCTEEVGLHQSKRTCNKNPGHVNFIPVKDFNTEHLPFRYRDNLLVDYVRATSDVTCRLSVSRISKDRPDKWPGRDQPFPFSACRGRKCTMTGTGWVGAVDKYTEDLNWDCRCDECRRPENTPKKTWGEIYIDTARHVVYDGEEAKHSKCQFFYDSHETDINKVLTLSEPKAVFSDLKGDFFRMEYITHDTELLDRFYQMWRRWKDLLDKVIDKYVSNMFPGLSAPGIECNANVEHDLCIIVSHPHGCSKVVTVGAWTDRDVVDKYGSDEEYITYKYNTPTCPGTSGAAVFTLCKEAKTYRPNDPPAHSEGRPGNDNNSGVGREDFYKPPT